MSTRWSMKLSRRLAVAVVCLCLLPWTARAFAQSQAAPSSQATKASSTKAASTKASTKANTKNTKTLARRHINASTVPSRSHRRNTLHTTQSRATSQSEYETVRISKPDGSIVYVRVRKQDTLRTRRTPWSHQKRVGDGEDKDTRVVNLRLHDSGVHMLTRGQAAQRTLIDPSLSAQKIDATIASHGVLQSPAILGLASYGRSAFSAAAAKATPAPSQQQAADSKQDSQTVFISRPFHERQAVATDEPLDKLVRSALGTIRSGSTGGDDTAVAGDDPAEWRTGRGWVPGGEDDFGGDYIGPDPEAIEVLRAGVEFAGPTPPPPPYGDENEPGYAEMAIARWDVVPYQLFSGDFDIGLLAFHMNGIDRVEISVEGGPWTALTQMQLNPRTHVKEYVAQLSADDINLQDDELIEIRAIAYPKDTGTPRLLDSLFLYVNNKGTLSGPPLYVAVSGNDSTGDGSEGAPFATIKKALDVIAANPASYESATIIVNEEGTYDIDSPSQKILNERWMTIKGASHLDRNNVIIAAGSTSDLLRPKVHWLKFENLSFDFSQSYQMYKEDEDHQWYDNCRWYSSAGWTYIPPGEIVPVRNGLYSGLYITDSLAENSLYGFVRSNLVRNCKVSYISGDAYRNSLLVVNSTADNVDGTVLAHHTDLFQYFGDLENVIVYNFNAAFTVSTQNIFLDHDQSSFKDMAFVNFTVQNAQSEPPFSQLSSFNEHILFYHVSNPGQGFVLRDDHVNGKFVAQNVIYRNCVVERIQAAEYGAPIPDGVYIDHTHFAYNDPLGEDPTTGSIAILNSQDGYFEYKGTGVGKLYQSGVMIPGLSDSTTPNRGSWPFEENPSQ